MAKRRLRYVKKSIALTPEQWDKIEDLAEHEMRSLSHVIRRILGAALSIPKAQWHDDGGDVRPADE